VVGGGVGVGYMVRQLTSLIPVSKFPESGVQGVRGGPIRGKLDCVEV
jgi:hypothetical protein